MMAEVIFETSGNSTSSEVPFGRISSLADRLEVHVVARNFSAAKYVMSIPRHPNARTCQAIEEARTQPLPRFNSVAELMADLDANN